MEGADDLVQTGPDGRVRETHFLFHSIDLAFTADKGLHEAQPLGRELLQTAEREMSFDTSVAVPAVQSGHSQALATDRALTDDWIH